MLCFHSLAQHLLRLHPAACLDRGGNLGVSTEPRAWPCTRCKMIHLRPSTCRYRCALEPVRRYPQAASYQAWVDSIDLKAKRLDCMPAVGSNVAARLEKQAIDSAPEAIGDSPGLRAPVSAFPGMKPFQISYDKLVIAVGAYSQTFNTPGVSGRARRAVLALTLPLVRRSKSTPTSSRTSRTLAGSGRAFWSASSWLLSRRSRTWSARIYYTLSLSVEGRPVSSLLQSFMTCWRPIWWVVEVPC